jgi:hypothetical protein
MLFKHKQKGFTIFELWFLLIGLVSFGVLGTFVYVGVHFISKWW